MNYYEIGQRIRKYRKAYNLSQEQLAEQVEISVTHLSHIETGNTKLSLTVFVNIANALNVQTDDLLYTTNDNKKTILKQEISDLINSCSPKELETLTDILKASKIALDKYIN